MSQIFHRISRSGREHFVARIVLLWLIVLCTCGSARTQNGAPGDPLIAPAYTLGPDDQVLLRVLDVEELDGKTVRVDLRGYIDVPLLGRMKAAGLTIEQLEIALRERLQQSIRQPNVTATVVEARSHPVSVLGSVNTPGVFYLTRPTTLLQLLSQAGGLRPDAGNTIKITRRVAWGPIPLPTAKTDSSGEFSVAEVGVKALLDAKRPEENIAIRPFDNLSVPKAELIYVVGAVRRPGGFPLSERENMSVLQALSMAEGLDRLASPKHSVLIRNSQTGTRSEILVDLKKVLSGGARDLGMQPNDILFVPSSAAKAVGVRGIEAAIQVATGVVIWGR